MIRLRNILESIEDSVLAPYAVKSINSLGRKYFEPEDDFRMCFQRDRDRILYSKSFRRLSRKTQVFPSVLSHDHVRNRYLHTCEVEQFWRVISRNLWLNEDLTEVIAKAHDIWHTPYWHSWQDALDALLKKEWFSFEHNFQSKRVLEVLEFHSKEYEWLNLSYEVLEWLWKHDIKSWFEKWALPYLEAQVVNIADEIAYLSWDLDDAISSWILNISDLENLEINKDIIDSLWIEKLDKTYYKRYIGNLTAFMVKDLIINSNINITKLNLKSQEDVEQIDFVIIKFSPIFQNKIKELRNFLFEKYYRNKNIVKMMEKWKKDIEFLFYFFKKNYLKLPIEYRKRIKRDGLLRCVADYISWMTDNYVKEIIDKIWNNNL